MFKNITKYIPLTTIILSYLFICGGLYLIGFWSTFNINISNFVSIIEIPTSFIYPFVLTQGFYLVNTITNISTSGRTIFDNEEPEKIPSTFYKKLLHILFSIDTLLVIIVLISYHFWFDNKMNPEFWLASGVAIAFTSTYKVQKISSIRKILPLYLIRYYVVNLVVVLPIMSFTVGKVDSLAIYNNTTKRMVIIEDGNTIIETKNLKFIGFLGDKAIVSSIDNKRITIINQSSYSKITIW